MALPEKEFFTYAEIAARWACKEEDIAHYVETGKLQAKSKLAIDPASPRGYTAYPVLGQRVVNDRVYVIYAKPSGPVEEIMWTLQITRDERDRFEVEHSIAVEGVVPSDLLVSPDREIARDDRFTKRCRALEKFLDAKEIPKDKRNPLEGKWTVKAIYEELVAADPLFHMGEESFKRHFWKRQKVCKLRDRKAK